MLASDWDQSSNPEFIAYCSRTISRIRSMQKRNKFSPQDYFQILKHLKISPEYCLDYFDYRSSIDRFPIVYAHKVDEEPPKDIFQLFQKNDEIIEKEKKNQNFTFVNEYLELIQVDGTPESYFEYVILAKLGHLFKLFDHALYCDQKILCSIDDLAHMMKEIPGFSGSNFPFEKAKIINYTPFVSVKSEEVIIRFISFNNWEGFFEEVYRLKRNEPVQINDHQKILLLEYRCCIMY